MSYNNTKFEQIINSPVNNSKAKQTFSFSKGNRFDEIRDKGSKTFTYELPTMKNGRTTGLGFGTKIDFVLKHINKKTPFYDMPSEFNTNKPTSPAFSFGIGRKYYEKVSYN